MIVRARHSRHRKPARGFVVVAVLWLLAMLAILAATFSLYVTNTNAALAKHSEKLQSEALVAAGVELTVYQLTVKREGRPLQGGFNFRSGRATVTVAFRGEAGRIDLNKASPELLAGLFVGLGGTSPEQAESYAARIVGWRIPTDAERPDSEASIYRAAGLNYIPRSGPFPHVGELSLVFGLPGALVERALPFLTVYSGVAEINPLLAPPEVIAALPGMTSERLYAALAQRNMEPQNTRALTSLLGPGARYATTEEGRATRVAVDVDLGNGRRTRTEVVILLLEEGDSEPYRVLSWSDEVYEVPPQVRSRVERR